MGSLYLSPSACLQRRGSWLWSEAGPSMWVSAQAWVCLSGLVELAWKGLGQGGTEGPPEPPYGVAWGLVCVLMWDTCLQSSPVLLLHTSNDRELPLCQPLGRSVWNDLPSWSSPKRPCLYPGTPDQHTGSISPRGSWGVSPGAQPLGLTHKIGSWEGCTSLSLSLSLSSSLSISHQFCFYWFSIYICRMYWFSLENSNIPWGNFMP
jgi:hypothetical protein